MFWLLNAYPHFLQSLQSVLPLLPLFHYPLESTLTVFDQYLQLKQMVVVFLYFWYNVMEIQELYLFSRPFRKVHLWWCFPPLDKIHLGKWLFVQRDGSTSNWPTTRGYLLIRALAVAFATVVLLTISSNSPNNKGLPVCLEYLCMRCDASSSSFVWRLSSS